MTDLGAKYIDMAFRSFRGYKRLGDGAITQLSDEELFRAPDEESNSVAVIMKHMAGNMISRWTDFLTSDGEKPDRNRDQEFIVDPATTTRADMEAYWERGWKVTLETIQSLKPEDLEKTIYIRSEPLVAIDAINRQIAHYAYHVGQIVFLAKHWRGREWKTLSIPKGQSSQVNERMAAGDRSIKAPTL